MGLKRIRKQIEKVLIDQEFADNCQQMADKQALKSEALVKDLSEKQSPAAIIESSKQFHALA